MKKIRFLQSISLHCSWPTHHLDHLLVYSVCELVHKSKVLISSRVTRIYMIISDRRYASHDWSNSYVCVMVGLRLDMLKFTEGGWQTVNSRREVQTGKPSSWTDKFLQGQNVFVNLWTLLDLPQVDWWVSTNRSARKCSQTSEGWSHKSTCSICRRLNSFCKMLAQKNIVHDISLIGCWTAH